VLPLKMHKHFKASITTIAKKVANSNFPETFRVVFKVVFSKLSGHFKKFYGEGCIWSRNHSRLMNLKETTVDK
jgi:hypothetical protein